MTPHRALLIENIEECERRFMQGFPSATAEIEREIGDLLERVFNTLNLAGGHRPSAIEAVERHVREILLTILKMVYRQRRADWELKHRYWLYN